MKTITNYGLAIFMLGFIFFSFHENSHAGFAMNPSDYACCYSESFCSDNGGNPVVEIACGIDATFVDGAACNEEDICEAVSQEPEPEQFACCYSESFCSDNGGNPAVEIKCEVDATFVAGAACNQESVCQVVSIEPEPPTRNIPTFSEWGLIAMAGVLGIIGLIAIRRRAVSTS